MSLLRLARLTDAAAVHAVYAPIVARTTISFELEVPSVDEVARRIDATLTRHPWLVCMDGDALLGYAYAGPYRGRAAYQWSAEVSVYVAEGARRRGVARALYTALLALLRLQGYHMVYAGVALPNDASIALHRALGFAPVGTYHAAGYKHGAWHDVQWFQQTLGPAPAQPAPPRSVEKARRLPSWKATLEAGAATVR